MSCQYVCHVACIVHLTGCAVDHGSDLRVFIEFTEELSRHLVIADLSELERDTTATVLWVALLQRVERVPDSIEDGVLWLASRLSISDGNDQDRLPKLSLGGPAEHYLVDDLLAQRRAHWGEALELNATHDLVNLGLGRNAVLEGAALLVTGTGEVGVHET